MHKNERMSDSDEMAITTPSKTSHQAVDNNSPYYQVNLEKIQSDPIKDNSDNAVFLEHTAQLKSKELSKKPATTLVSKSIYSFLVNRLDNDKALIKLAFNISSHLLAHSNLSRINKEMFIDFGSKKNNSTLRKQKGKLITKGIIIERKTEFFNGSPAASYYNLSAEVMQCLIQNTDCGYFNTYNYADKGEYYYPKPSNKLDNRIKQMIQWYPDLAEIILDLQKRPFYYNKKAHLQFNKGTDRDWIYQQMLVDGRNYTRYSMGSTGRLYTTNYNFQGIPRSMRKWFYPEEGYRFLDFDFSNQEPHIIAYLSGDHELLDYLENGNDMYGLLMDDIQDRDTAKKVTLQAFNGGTVKGIAKTIFRINGHKYCKFHTEFAKKKVIEPIFNQFPGVMEWRIATTRKIIETGIATTRGGLSSRILPEEASTKGVSHIVQGTGSDILHRILLTINEPLSKVGAYLQLPIHDGLLIASPIGREDEVIAIVKGVMNNAVSAILPGYSIGITCEKGWKMKNENWEHCNLDPRNK